MTETLLIVSSLLILLWLSGLYWFYGRQRRQRIGDSQPLFYPPGSFHSLCFVRLAPEQSLADSIQRLRHQLGKVPGVEVVYAGQTLLIGCQSSQLGGRQWDAVLLSSHPSRKAFDRLWADRYPCWLEGFADYHMQGFKRPVLANAFVPLALWATRVGDRLRKRPSHFPFATVQHDSRHHQWRTCGPADGATAGDLPELAHNAVVEINLIESGSTEQRKATARFNRAMRHLMAEGRHGPTHLGQGVNLNNKAHFDQLALVYYPGIIYLRSMSESQFFADIQHYRQLQDSLTLVTVPLSNLNRDR